jgi:hypothetical protein
LSKGGKRRLYGSTRSLGFRRGSLVQHNKLGVCYVGGTSKNSISLHSLETGKRLSQNIVPGDCKFRCYLGWRISSFPTTQEKTRKSMKINSSFWRIMTMNTNIEVEVSELTKTYAVVNGERIEFDQPWEETPNHEDFVKWLTNIQNELVKENVTESKRNSREISHTP